MPAELTAAGGKFIATALADGGQARVALGAGADLLVDCHCYTAADARSLLPLATNSASTVVISSRAVYVDAADNHVNSATPPRFGAPIRENQPTLAGAYAGIPTGAASRPTRPPAPPQGEPGPHPRC